MNRELWIVMKSVVALILSALLAGQAAWAAEAKPAAADPQLEKRVMTLAEELRCLVCQNETIADSNAPLAVDLREQVREKLREGMTNEQILGYMVERYGEFVLYRPRVKASTLALWFGPLLLLIAGIIVLMRSVRARRGEPVVVLSEVDRARAASLLAPREGRP